MDSPATSPPPPAGARAVGDRVDDSAGSLGTVRYVGPVATAKDASTVYYGIEWDVWGRGKNDGGVQLPSGERVVHFSGPPGRVTPALGGSDVVVTGGVGTTLGSEKPIEFVGAKKLSTQQTLQTIEKISLSGCQIAELGSAEGSEGLTTLAPNLTELDLSRNLLNSWNDILAIVRELPLLETLILSGNRFAVNEEVISDSDNFPNVKVLVLNQTLLPWCQAVKLVTRHFPRLQELHLVGNEYENDQLAEESAEGSWMETLSVLDLSLNQLSSWKRVLQTVGDMFANLSQLFLNDNRFVTLVIDTTEPVIAFQKMSALSLSGNLVNSWTSIDALNAFPQMDTLRFSKNPLIEQMSLGETRMLVVARTDNIAVFNASVVRAKERREAEQLYLKRILHELAVVGEEKGEHERVLAAHPRYSRLQQMYPEISIDQSGGASGNNSAAGPRKLASSLIKVKIVPMSMQATSLDPLVKKIPQQMKVAQLKLLIETKFGVEVPAQVLSFRLDSRSMPMLLDDDNAEVSYYGIQNDSEVLVNDNE
ncbi:hypothetical protein BBJ29_008578 [Phytophthora kernoviae]|uniref:CAP-Gly domain-containing protein n=1 Tax=Phytophthora kernoviae TaxID=325452 RepID=A0A3F2RB97_9STRA|nr:hypothetical protein BBJ29_008578 [Phytophthora kernoviae]RLN51357.1 hypothetical protein BBP00_00009905 [Phytophthora kernoviae]